jgi:ABC-type transporter Mla subunit MlaD
MDTANLFRVRLEDIVVQLGRLQDEVAAKSRKTVDDTHQILEKSMESHSERLAQFYEQLSDEVKKQSVEAATDLRTLTQKLVTLVDSYGKHVEAEMTNVVRNLENSSNDIKKTLEAVVIPQDFFAQKLTASVDALASQTEAAASAASALAERLETNSRLFQQTIETLHASVKSATPVLGYLDSLSIDQPAIARVFKEQTDTNRQLSENIRDAKQTATELASRLSMQLESLSSESQKRAPLRKVLFGRWSNAEMLPDDSSQTSPIGLDGVRVETIRKEPVLSKDDDNQEK